MIDSPTRQDAQAIKQAVFSAIMQHYGMHEEDSDDQADASELTNAIMQRLAGLGSGEETPPTSPEFVRVGTWLSPDAYGNDYDHFTGTTMETRPGQCIALYAKAADLVDSPFANRITLHP